MPFLDMRNYAFRRVLCANSSMSMNKARRISRQISSRASASSSCVNDAVFEDGISRFIDQLPNTDNLNPQAQNRPGRCLINKRSDRCCEWSQQGRVLSRTRGHISRSGRHVSRRWMGQGNRLLLFGDAPSGLYPVVHDQRLPTDGKFKNGFNDQPSHI